MKKRVRINYQSIFKYPDNQEKVAYKEIGTLNQEKDYTSLSFLKDKIKLIFKDHEIVLHHDKSVLKLHEHQDVLNNYQTEYGTIQLVTRLVKYQKGDSYKIKYLLLQNNEVISEVYIIVNYQLMEN